MWKILIVQATVIVMVFVFFGGTLSFGQQIVPEEDGFNGVYAAMTSGAYIDIGITNREDKTQKRSNV